MILRISRRTIKGLLLSQPAQTSYHTYDQSIKRMLDRAQFSETEEMQAKIKQLRSVSRVLIDFNKEIANASSKSEHTLLDTLTKINYEKDGADNAIVQEKRAGLTHVQSFFKDGIDVDLTVFAQERIKQPQQANSNKRFIFIPTTSVTTPIFKTLLFEDQNRLILYGQFGVAKTTSIMLFTHFSSIINRYLVLAPEEERREFLQSLGKDRDYVPKKIFYWSMVMIENERERKTEEKRILYQAAQLNLPNENIDTFIMKQRYLEKGIKCAVVFDQMNAIAANLRQGNKKYENKQKPLTDIQTQLNPTTKALDFRSQLKILGNSIYNSSVNYERDLLYINHKEFNFKLSNHTPVPTFFIDYSANYGTKLRTAENCEFLERELQSQLPPQQYLKIKDSIREIALKYFPECSLVRPYMIFQAIKNKQKIIPSEEEERTKWMVTLLQSIQYSALRTFSDKLQRYLKIDKSSDRFTVIEDIYYILFQKLGNKIQREADGEIREEESTLIPVSLLSYFRKQESKGYDEEQIVSQELFSFVYEKNTLSHIKVLMPVTDTQHLIRMNPFVASSLLAAQCRFLEEIYKRQDMATAFGTMFQWTFLKGVRQNSQNPKFRIQFRNKVIPIKSQSSFVQFKSQQLNQPKSEKDKQRQDKPEKGSKRKLNNLDKIIQQCYQHKDQYIFGFPVKDDGSVASTSPSIDFMIAIIQKTARKPKLVINSFDFATSRNPDNIKKKFAKKLVLNAFKAVQKNNEKTQEFSQIKWYQNIVTIPLIDPQSIVSSIEPQFITKKKAKYSCKYRRICFDELRFAKEIYPFNDSRKVYEIIVENMIRESHEQGERID